MNTQQLNETTHLVILKMIQSVKNGRSSAETVTWAAAANTVVIDSNDWALLMAPSNVTYS